MFFAVHPIHVESVSNVTGRAEVLFGLFYIIGFLAYARLANAQRGLCVGAVACVVLCTNLSLYSKEPGITLPVLCALWDLIMLADVTPRQVLGSLCTGSFWRGGSGRSPTQQRSWLYLQRTVVLASANIAIAAYRLHLNGGSGPNFIRDQNPQAFADDTLTRFLSIRWIHCLYLWTMLVPINLCCDWSADSIPLVASLSDPRAAAVVALYSVLLVAAVAFLAIPQWTPTSRRRAMASAFIIVPFALQSNWIFVVGFVMADRVMYVPSIGFCMLLAQVIDELVNGCCCGGGDGTLLADGDASTIGNGAEGEGTRDAGHRTRSGGGTCGIGAYLKVSILVVLASAYGYRCHQRNLDWSDGYLLWQTAHDVNPRSEHIMHNLGLQLAWKRRHEDALAMFRKSMKLYKKRHGGEWDFASLTAQAWTLQVLNRCSEAIEVIEEGIEVLHAEREPVAERGKAGKSGKSGKKKKKKKKVKKRNQATDGPETAGATNTGRRKGRGEGGTGFDFEPEVGSELYLQELRRFDDQESMLLVPLATCQEDYSKMGKILYKAIQLNPKYVVVEDTVAVVDDVCLWCLSWIEAVAFNGDAHLQTCESSTVWSQVRNHKAPFC